MKLRRLVTLALVICMVLSVAIFANAADYVWPGTNVMGNYMLDVANINLVSVTAGGTANCMVELTAESTTITIANLQGNATLDYMRYFTEDANGNLVMEGVPAGSYTIQLNQLHPMMGTTAEISFSSGSAEPDPEGSRGNPYAISALPYEGSAVIADGASNGVFYKYECVEGGRYFIEIDAANAASGWEYQLVGEWDGSEYKWGDTHCSVDGSASDYIDLDAGDVLVIYVNTYGRSYYPGSDTLYDVTHPAGTVGFSVSYAAKGSEQVPNDLSYGAYDYIAEGENGVWYELNSADGHMLKITANGMTVKVDGVAQTPDADGLIVAYVDAGVHKIQVLNAGVEEPYFDCSVFAKGTGDYPFDAVLGENVQNEKPYYSGKIYSYTAPVDGTLTLVMNPDGDWYYEIANVDAKIYYGPFTSADETVKSTYSLHVNAGEEILLYVQNGAESSFIMEEVSMTFELWFKGDKEGSLGNAINVNVPADLNGIDAAAGADVYYSISSQLNGQLLTIVGNDDIVVTLNGVVLEADNGVYVVELTGVPTNALVVTNKGDKDASYVASISWAEGSESNPAAINAIGDYTASVAAGKEYFYAVNAKLNNAVLVVKNASYVIVDGTKYEAENGVVTAALKSDAATISVVVGNSGTADASVQLTVDLNDNPKMGVTGILLPVAAALLSAMGTAALVIKKKEF